jgi:acyl carrier protein
MDAMDSLLKDAGSGSRDTRDRVRRVFIESLQLNLREEDFSYQATLDESVGLDSVAVLDFVAALEKEFDITFEPEMLTVELVRDLNELTAYVGERTARRRHPKTRLAGERPA